MAAAGFGLNPFQERQIDRSQPTLLKSIQNVSRFQAAVGNFEKVIDTEDDIAGVPECQLEKPKLDFGRSSATRVRESGRSPHR